MDLDRKKVRIRHYDARMGIPLTWDEDGVTECAFVTRAFYRGKAVDQLQMHLRGGAGFSADPSQSSPSTSSHGISNGLLTMNDEETYKIVTVCFDHEGNELSPVGVAPVYDTGCAFPTFGIVKPAVTNTRVDMSPYGQSVFADAVDAVQAVDLTFDALINEVDVSKMRVFLSDVLFDRERNGDKTVSIPFGKSDCAVFRKVMSTEDTIQEFAPTLRTNSQSEAFRIARAVMAVSRGFGEQIPKEGSVRVQYDDRLLVKDTSASRAALSASEVPYEGAAEMLLVDVEDRDAVAALVADMLPELPEPKRRRR